MADETVVKTETASAAIPGAVTNVDDTGIKALRPAAELKHKTGLPEELIQGTQDWFIETWLAKNKPSFPPPPPVPEKSDVEELNVKDEVKEEKEVEEEKEGDAQKMLEEEEKDRKTPEPPAPQQPPPIPPLDDPDNPPKLPLRELWSFLNMKYIPEELFKYPTLDELSRYVEKATGKEWPLEVTWPMIRKYLEIRVKKADPYKELIGAFKVFDSEREGCLELEELLLIMKNPAFGDPMTETELKEFIHDANMTGDGVIHYEKLVKAMFTITPELHNVEVDFVKPPVILDWKSFLAAKNETSQEQKEP